MESPFVDRSIYRNRSGLSRLLIKKSIYTKKSTKSFAKFYGNSEYCDFPNREASSLNASLCAHHEQEKDATRISRLLDPEAQIGAFLNRFSSS